MDSAKSVEVLFGQFELTITKSLGEGRVLVNPPNQVFDFPFTEGYAAGTTITMEAQPATGYAFLSWWGDITETTDVRENLEAGKSYKWSRFYLLNESQYQELLNFVSTDHHWTYWYTCAAFASDAVWAATGEDLDADDTLGFETPRELSKSIAALELADPTSEIDPKAGEGPGGSSLSSFECSPQSPCS